MSSKAIKDKGVAGKDLRDGAITASKVATGAVTSNAIAPGAVRSSNGTATQGCLAGELAMGAGAVWDDDTGDVSVVSTRYLADGSGRPTGVEVKGRNETAVPRQLQAQVLCLAP